MPTHDEMLARYEASITPETASTLAALEQRARNPKKPRTAAPRKPRTTTATPPRPAPHDAHMKTAASLLSQCEISAALGHDPLPLAYFAKAKAGDLIADVCNCTACHPLHGSNPPRGPEGWGATLDNPQVTHMGPGFRAPGIRLA